MCVDAIMDFKFSLRGIMYNACLGLVINATGQSLCFISMNENWPWSTAARRYLVIRVYQVDI